MERTNQLEEALRAAGVQPTTMLTNPVGWVVVRDEEKATIQVLPLNDIKIHNQAEKCWCMPRYDGELDEADVWVHSSADNRENTYERGKLQ